jgi:hypothetical protein
VLTVAGASTSTFPVDLGLARFDLALELHLLEQALEAEFNWNTALFEPGTVERLAADFESVLAQGMADPNRRLLSFELASNTWTEADAGRAGRSGSIRGFRRAAQSSS